MTSAPATPDEDPGTRVDGSVTRDEGPASRTVLTLERRPPSGEKAWLFTLLPAFPLLLLVLRVWYLARQDLQTMLLVLQSANPLGLIASLLISLLWALPAVVLLLRVLYLLLLVSEVPSRSWLARAGVRMPIWLSVPATLLALLTWELRFLPTLLALALVIGGLEARHRFGPDRFVSSALGTAVPIALGVLTLVWLAPAILTAFGPAGEPVTAALLLVPPLAAPLLCGPIPARVARWLLPGIAGLLALSGPILLSSSYLSTPVLPRVAVQSTPAPTTSAATTPAATAPGAPAPEAPAAAAGPAPAAAKPTVIRGSLVSVDDRFTTLLDRKGQVHFLPGGDITAQVLCITGPEEPSSTVTIHGWQVEQSVLSWAAPRPLESAPEALMLCRGD